jgi:hypothetical protein
MILIESRAIRKPGFAVKLTKNARCGDLPMAGYVLIAIEVTILLRGPRRDVDYRPSTCQGSR